MKPAPEDDMVAAIDTGDMVSVTAADGHELKGRLWWASKNAPLLVAAHGVMSHGLWFHQLAEALRARGIALLVFDRRGAGLNRGDPGEPEDDQTLIDDLGAWMDLAATISDERHLVGFCWGSNYMLHYLGQLSDGVKSLILMAPGVVPSTNVAIRRSIDNLAPETRLPITLELEDFTRGPALEGFLRPDPLRLTHTSARFVSIQNRIGRWSAVRLAKLRLPLLAILAEQDNISDNDKTRGLIDRSSASPKTLIDVPGRHGIIFDAPIQIADACRDWLDRLRSTADRSDASSSAAVPNVDQTVLKKSN
ncbi:MAG: alpha/beta hydrolase [Geminicoccaceae bacterium]